MSIEPMTVTYGDIREGDFFADASLPRLWGRRVIGVMRTGETVGLTLTHSGGVAGSANRSVLILREAV